MWQAGLVHGMKNETGWGHCWQLCHKASVRMTGPKTPACPADISAANQKVQALTAAGPRDGERVNNLESCNMLKLVPCSGLLLLCPPQRHSSLPSMFHILDCFWGFTKSPRFFSCSYVTLLWQLRWTEHRGRYSITSAASPLVAGTPMSLSSHNDRSSVGGRGRCGQAENTRDGTGSGQSGRKWGWVGGHTRWSSGPLRCFRDGCQLCTQVKLKWLQCDGTDASRRAEMHNAERTFGAEGQRRKTTLLRQFVATL